MMEASTAVDAEGEQIDLRAPAGEDVDPDEVGLNDDNGPGDDSPETARDDSVESSGDRSPEDGSPGNELLGNGSDDMRPDEEA